MVKVNPLRNQPDTMPLKDACIVALILTFASFFTVFFPAMTFTGVLENPAATVWYSIGYLGGQFFTNMIVLGGLAKYTNSRYKEANK